MNIKNLIIAAFALSAVLFAVPASASAASTPCVDRVFDKGDSGTCVKYIQTLNNVYAPQYANKLSVDGAFGSLTQKSIKKVQSSFGLKSDGIVGNNTWRLLCTYQAGWTDENGINHMYIPSNWPLSTAKAAGCAKYWKGSIVDGVRY